MHYNIKKNSMYIFFEKNLDYKNIPVLKKQLSKPLKQNKIKSLIFDLDKVDFMDTSGLSFFIFFSEKYRVNIVNVSSELEHIFDLNKKKIYKVFLK